MRKRYAIEYNKCTYLEAVLRKFGLSEMLMNAILSLYLSPSAKVWTSGVVSSPFNILNGTRQGCLLSPLIFTMVTETLAQKFGSKPLVTGINIGTTKHKIGLYVDDVITAFTNPERSLPKIQCVLDQFSAIPLTKKTAVSHLC